MIKVAIPRQFQGLLRLGTCSWKNEAWKGLLSRYEGSGPLSIGRLLEALSGCVEPPGPAGGPAP